MRLARPNDLELAYTRSMMAFLLFNAAPRRVLMVGLGGGSLAKFIYHRLPEAVYARCWRSTRDVVAIARRFFQVPAADERFTMRVVRWRGIRRARGAGLRCDPGGRLRWRFAGRSAFVARCFTGPACARLERQRRAGGESVGRRPQVQRLRGSASKRRFLRARCACRPRSRATLSSCSLFATRRGIRTGTSSRPERSSSRRATGSSSASSSKGLRKMNRCDDERLYVSGEA